jgi:hypothetical protein
VIASIGYKVELYHSLFLFDYFSSFIWDESIVLIEHNAVNSRLELLYYHIVCLEVIMFFPTIILEKVPLIL